MCCNNAMCSWSICYQQNTTIMTSIWVHFLQNRHTLSNDQCMPTWVMSQPVTNFIKVLYRPEIVACRDGSLQVCVIISCQRIICVAEHATVTMSIHHIITSLIKLLITVTIKIYNFLLTIIYYNDIETVNTKYVEYCHASHHSTVQYTRWGLINNQC